MTLPVTASTSEVPAGMRAVPELDAAREVWPRGRRLEALVEAGEAFKERFKAQGEVLAARNVDLVKAPYPTTFAFHGAVRIPTAPWILIRNRVVVVQYVDFDGARRTLVWEPTVPEGSERAPFFAQTAALLHRLPGGDWLREHLLTEVSTQADRALTVCGLTPDDVDFVSFDHLHVQDVRLIMGSRAGAAGDPAAPLFSRAALLTQDRELATLEDLHPMQWAWYVPDSLDGAQLDHVRCLPGSVELGVGVALIWTPGHTDGNHSLVINTPDGIWVSSENGVALDNWQPERSRIPGLRRYARFYRRSVVPNANTLEDALDQYDSMVLERTLADPCRTAPDWPQILPSSELAASWWHWPIKPTHAQTGFSYGRMAGRETS